MTEQDALAREFEEHRARIVGLAYRVLGSRADAEDVVQDAWLRFAGADRPAIEEPAAWLTTVTTRLCLDRLRSARVRRETYVGPWLPEPWVQPLDAPPGPEQLALLDESVRLALLVVLEELSPEQRVAFVLHDVFAVPFADVAESLGTSVAAARQLASRARRAVREHRPPPAVPLPRQREVVEAFTRAAFGGDLDGLVRTLAPDVVLRSDGGGRVSAALRPVVGPDHVARFLLGLRTRAGTARVDVVPVLVNGELGALVEIGESTDGHVASGITVVLPRVGPDGLVHEVDMVRNPDKLTRVRVPVR
ncbi:RNA polymerase sigma factor SigJ [Cellulomonas cellasea]|uniref:RNA polymerase sigma-70 factor (ECF subfamily) n=1 Tax=Cellulomonas cellasea TaxID=43670 RepID=A0A7W4YCF1_9CELL|nr:RNA polymerase sigma factor SigJ [Cellulomonas cellasea]MBB2923501.1 RNA polymerase sigma-70 factor (ECF subfamily) [Cellulomonas cellasea]